MELEYSWSAHMFAREAPQGPRAPHEAPRYVMKRRPTTRTRKDPNRYPRGWNAASIRWLIDHYENQSEEDAVAEDEAAYRSTEHTIMAVPVQLVPEVQRLIAKRAG